MSTESFELPPNEFDGPPPRRRQWLRMVVTVIVLALVGVGGAHAWVNAESLMRLLPWRITAVSATGTDDKATLTDLIAAQRKASDDLVALQRAQAEQRDQLAAITGRLSELASKMDALQNAATAPRAAPPNVAAAQPIPVPAVVPKPKRSARTPPPSGPISVGGGPLTPKPAPTAQ